MDNPEVGHLLNSSKSKCNCEPASATGTNTDMLVFMIYSKDYSTVSDPLMNGVESWCDCLPYVSMI